MNALIVALLIIVGMIYQPISTLLLLILMAVVAPFFARAANDSLSGR